MQFTRCADDFVDGIAGAQAGPDEHPTDMDVNRHVAAAHVVERDGEVAGEDLDRHRCLLLADAVEGLKPSLEGPSARPICPEPPHVAAKILCDSTRCADDPARSDLGVAVRHRPGLHSEEDGRLVASHSFRI
jgi:hypothetical protein